MSWHLLVPVVEKLIDIGVEYYNSSSNEPQKAIVVTEESKETTTTSEASILITVEKEGGVIDESALRSAMETMSQQMKLKITAITIDIQEGSKSGS